MLRHFYSTNLFLEIARVFLEMKKHDEALIQLKLLTQVANYRFEVHECLVHAFIGVSRWREAQLQAIEACRILGKSPRIYVVSTMIECGSIRFLTFFQLESFHLSVGRTNIYRWKYTTGQS